MCGDIPKGHYAKDVTIAFTTNQTSIRLPLPFKFENVEQIRLREVFVKGAAATGLWRLQVNPDQTAQEVSNANGEGTVIGVDNTGVTHTIFTNPRVITDVGRGTLIDCVATISAVDATNNIVTPTFTQAFFVLQFIMKKPFYDPQATLDAERANPLNARGQYSTRAPFNRLF